jgi:hypothetical protein
LKGATSWSRLFFLPVTLPFLISHGNFNPRQWVPHFSLALGEVGIFSERICRAGPACTQISEARFQGKISEGISKKRHEVLGTI